MNEDSQLHVEGPTVNERTGEQSYTVTEAGHTVHFSLQEERSNGRSTWKVNLEGVPDPGIIHREPWTTPEMARDAALRAVHTMLDIEVIRDEVEEALNPDEPDPCADETGDRS